ncbi:MAG TPA: glycosyltransferase [Candidatus Paceibacterota bacterium]|nr:glycosyltransferase [Candidatus Paceibacterota bacterium]
MTRVLMISTDAKILEEGSAVRVRMAEYGQLFEELHIVVFCRKNFRFSHIDSQEGGEGAGRIQISRNIFAYPTLSASKLLYVRDALKIGSSLFDNRKSNIDNFVISTQDPFETGLVGARLSEKFGVPLHVQIHTDFHSPYFKGSLLNKVRIALARRSLSRARAVRAVSERIRSSLPESWQLKASVLPIFADLQAIRGAPAPAEARLDLRKKYPQFDKVVLMASRLTKEKDFGTAIAAFSEALKGFPRAGLVIVGEGPQKEEIGARSRELGIEKSVAVEPWADRQTLVSYMKSCDAFLSASLYEGYGLSMLEAHTSGAPLIATDAGIAPLLASKEGLVPPQSSKTMAISLKKALGGELRNRKYEYPYSSRQAYMEAYKRDVERALL